jgi:hypothetical protein
MRAGSLSSGQVQLLVLLSVGYPTYKSTKVGNRRSNCVNTVTTVFFTVSFCIRFCKRCTCPACSVPSRAEDCQGPGGKIESVRLSPGSTLHSRFQAKSCANPLCPALFVTHRSLCRMHYISKSSSYFDLNPISWSFSQRRDESHVAPPRSRDRRGPESDHGICCLC